MTVRICSACASALPCRFTRVDGGDGHVDRELDRVVGPRQALLCPASVRRTRPDAAAAPRDRRIDLPGHRFPCSHHRLPCSPCPRRPMPSRRDQASRSRASRERRNRLGVPAFAGGFLFLLSAIIITSTLNGAPTVGLVQGLAPALHGEGEPAGQPARGRGQIHQPPRVRADRREHDQSAIVAGVLTLVLLLLLDATRFRRPETLAVARPLLADRRHRARGRERRPPDGQLRSRRTIRRRPRLQQPCGRTGAHHRARRTSSGATSTCLRALALVVGMIATCVNAMRVGLLHALDGRARDLHGRADPAADRRREPLKSCPPSGLW